MNKAGYPYDNAPMERYFNTLKNEYINLYEYKTEEALYQAVEEFSYVEYNYVRPHSYNVMLQVLHKCLTTTPKMSMTDRLKCTFDIKAMSLILWQDQ